MGSERPALKDYYVASSVDEALAYLSAYRGEAQLMGGGTLLMPRVHRGEIPISRLVDISRICSTRRIIVDGNHLYIGATASFSTLVKNTPIREQAPIVHDAASRMGTPPVRRLATLGGNIISAVGNAHALVALITLGAEVEITNLTGSQWLPVASLSARHGVSRVDSTTEAITSVRVSRLWPGRGSALQGLNLRETGGRDLLILGLDLALHEDGETVHRSAAVMGAVGTLPTRLEAAEAALVGASVHDRATLQAFVTPFAEAAHAALEDPLRGAEERVFGLAEDVFHRAVHIALGRSGIDSDHDGA
ncbi:MAG TPA: hypothetical protein GX702_14870 [Chloroflexi bacterium]|nr:hypothetical protein [Chloroflexota bacterium]